MTAPPPARHADFRFARVTALHRLGPRALAELLAEFGCEHLIRSAIETKLRRYIERLTPGLLRAVGGDRFPASPIRIVPSG